MPTRYIKESARTSKNLSLVSDFSERLFWRLITTADDFGRFLACPVIVKSTCFPLMEKVKSYKIEQSLGELRTHSLIGIYAVGDRQYGWFVNWQKHQGKPRAIASKYPDIPSSFLDLPVDARTCLQSPTDSLGYPDTDTDTDTDLNPLHSSESVPDLKSNGHAEAFEQFWLAYPKKVGKKAALKAWEKAKDKPEVTDMIAVVEQSKQTEQWMKENGEYIPHPSKWLNEGRWADQPIQKAPSVMEAFLSRGDIDDPLRLR